MLPRIRALALPLAVALVAFATPAAAKGKLNCRTLSFAGQAGDCMPPDLVQIRIVDVNGDEIHKSCANVQVIPHETALQFGARMPRDIGTYTDLDCGAHILDPDPPTKKCVVGSGGSCKYKWKASKQVLEVCCWEPGPTPCSGLKIGNYCVGGTTPNAKCTGNADCTGGFCRQRTGTQGISAQKQIQGTDTEFLPTPPPVAVANVLVQLDPISMAERPFPALGSCRVAVAKAALTLASTTLHVLVDCHTHQLKGVPIADCSTVNTESDPGENVAAAEAALDTAVQGCATGGSPFALGYHACPAPCDGVVINTCAAGQVGAPCTSDAACDSSVGAGDGKCGQAQNWSALGNCIACVAEDAVTTAVDDKYGTAGPGLPPEEIVCQDGIGKALATTTLTHLQVTTKCQKLLDGGKTVLAFCQAGVCVAPADHVGAPCLSEDDCAPPDARLCKYADQSGGRTAAETSARTEIDKTCGSADLTQLDTCDVTLAGLEDCVVQNARDASGAIADAIFPEGIGH